MDANCPLDPDPPTQREAAYSVRDVVPPPSVRSFLPPSPSREARAEANPPLDCEAVPPEAPRAMSPDAEQRMRLAAYDQMTDRSTMDFLLETRDAVLPSGLTHVVGGGVLLVARSASAVRRAVPKPVHSAVRFTGHQLAHLAAWTGDAVDAAPDAVMNAIPDALMSRETKHLVFVDFTNVLRCHFHTNVLSVPYVFRSAGLVGGLLLTVAVAAVSLYCTEAFFAAKHQLRAASRVYMYGDVPRLTWGDWYPALNLFYGVVHVIGFLAFAGANMRVLLQSGHADVSHLHALSLVIPPLVALPLVWMKRAGNQRPLGVLSSVLVFVGCLVMMADFPYTAARIPLFPDSVPQFFIALGVSVYGFTGIGGAVPVERTMSPSRYIALLRIASAVAFLILVGFGLSGFLSFGAQTCSVMTQSLRVGGRKTAASALLFVASVFIIPQQVFPLAELMDRRFLGIRHLPRYGEVWPNLMRVGIIAGCAATAYVVPYYGLILAIAGAFGCGIIGIIVPAALDYVRRRRTALHERRGMRFWEYLLCFALGLFGVFVVIVGVAFGLYNLWINIQTNSSSTC